MGDARTSAVAPLRAWCDEWMELATFGGPYLPDTDLRIDALVELWQRPVPPGWKRSEDRRLLDPHRRYTRGNGGLRDVRRGEHAIEYDILAPDPATVISYCLGAPLVDGVNAVPLTTDIAGGRVANVEADMLLLTGDHGGHRLLLVEVKANANNPWYAAVESLRQLRLMSESLVTQGLFHTRRPGLRLAAPLPISGVVVAPRAYYAARGQKRNALQPARKLLDRMHDAVGVDAALTTWEPSRRAIERLS